MLPKISIIIPCYNHGKYVREAIESVQKCSDKNLYEIIIINDGSTDKLTIEVLQQLTEEGYNIINQTNQGLGAARNNAIKKAVGEYILPLDSDNKIRAEYIYESIKILDAHPEIAMVYGDAEFFGEKTAEHIVGEFNLQKIMLDNYIDACAVYRKSVWEKLGGYDENMPVMGLEDWDMWLRMAFNNYTFHYIPKTLYDYRVVKNSMINSINENDTVVIGNYMQLKHKQYLGTEYVNRFLLNIAKKNKKIIFKLFLELYFPAILNFLIKRKIIKNRDIL